MGSSYVVILDTCKISSIIYKGIFIVDKNQSYTMIISNENVLFPLEIPEWVYD